MSRLIHFTDQSGRPLWVGPDALVCVTYAGQFAALTLLTGGPSPYTTLLVNQTLGQIAALMPRGPGGRSPLLKITEQSLTGPATMMLVAMKHIVTAAQSAKRNVLVMQGGKLIATRDRVGPLLAREDAS